MSKERQPSALAHTAPFVSGEKQTNMRIARVVGTVVSTEKNRRLQGAKLLLVQPLGPDRQPVGPELLAVDSLGAGIGEQVLIVIEGRAAGDALGDRRAPVDTAVVGIIDHIDEG